MKTPTQVFSKNADTDTVVQIDVGSRLLHNGETITALTLGAVTPVSATPLVISAPDLSQMVDGRVSVLLTAGQLNVSYGADLLVTTTGRQFMLHIAVVVAMENFDPYAQLGQDPDAFTDLVDTMEAGKATIGTAMFTFPPGIDAAGGYVNWELFDGDGVVYAAGNAYEYQITAGMMNMVRALCIINCPSDVPPSSFDCKYQLRYTLTLPNVEPGAQSQFYMYENLTVVGLTTVPTGTQDVVELVGKPARTEIVIAGLYDTVTLTLYRDNTEIGKLRVDNPTRVASGYYYAATFGTTALPASLEPYTAVWSYLNSADPGTEYSENAAIYIVTPTVLNAISDVKAKINKARTTLYGQPDLLFPAATILTWMRRARDAFNGAGGNFTSFTMLNAKGSIREYWLMYTELGAIEAQYMAEGEKAFDYSGAAISLTVDRTGYLDNMAGKIRSFLDSEMKPFKQNLIIKGNTSGDGSADPSKLQPGAIGAVGITITPASPWGLYNGLGSPYPRIL